MNHKALPQDIEGRVQPSGEAPISHPLLIREEIYFNENGDPVKIVKVFKTSEADATPVSYSQNIMPQNGDDVIDGNPMIFYPWVKVV